MIKLLKKIYHLTEKVWWNALNSAILSFHHVHRGKRLNIHGLLKVYGKGKNITIADNARFNSGTRYNVLGGSDKMVLCAGKNGKISIGYNAGASNSCIHSRDPLGITIEANVNIGNDCKIYDTDFHSVDYICRMESPDTHVKTAPVVIKEGAWIGAHSIILKGVTIGERSVIGAGSIVTKDVPADQCWAGNPARFIKDINR